MFNNFLKKNRSVYEMWKIL